MYRANRAKYAQHPDLQADLLATGDVEIAGAPSTSWNTRAGRSVNWSLWNGLIQMRIREELRAPEERRPGVLEDIVEQFDGYLAGEGGSQLPLPEAGEGQRPPRLAACAESE